MVPELIGKNWLEEVKNAAFNYRDESFIQQFMSPTLIRKWKLFKVRDIAVRGYMDIEAIHNENGYRDVRKALAKQQSLSTREPEILINHVNLTGSRNLYLKHNRYNGIGLDTKSAKKVIRNIEILWGYPVVIDSVESVLQFDGSWEDKIIASYDVLTYSET